MTTDLSKVAKEKLRKALSHIISSKRFLGIDFEDINFLIMI